MTKDKQIIDGVDVRGCEFATKAETVGDEHCRLYDYRYCIGKDCYYKQLKRKEQECEELRKQYNCYACDTCKGKEDYKNMKKHCENAIKSLHNKQTELDQLKADNKHLNDLLNQALKELEESREAIEKIKEIAKKKVAYFPDGEIFARPEIEQILQICDEVNE